MLKKVGFGSHAVVGVSILAMTALAGFGVIGAGDDGVLRPEHFDAKQVTVLPAGGEGVRIREVVDIDFGAQQKRGYQRVVPNDFGVPTDVVASSPDANDELDVVDFGNETRIRVGNPNITFSGRHRYELEYTLPEARLSTGQLALDIIGTDETLRTDRFEVVVTGFELGDPTCDTGGPGDFGGCELRPDASGNLTATIEPLEPGDGISIGGTIESIGEPNPPPVPDPPDPLPSGFRPLGSAMIPLGLLGAGGVFLLSRRYGSNVVAGTGGAADAAYGELPAPNRGDPVADVPTHRVPDSRLAELATVEFVPPRGLEPWQGAALLRERVDDDTVSAWFSEMVARRAIEISEDGDTVVLEPGAATARLSAVDRRHLERLFRSASSIELGTYDSEFTSTWQQIAAEQRRFVRETGWWQRGAPGQSALGARAALRVLGVFALVVLVAGGWVLAFGFLGALASPWVALGLGLVVPAFVAFLVYQRLLPSRSATGSALALRTESFRRFLAASEGRHVEWAWERNLLREYSAWAVALGAADAWRRAVESSNIPHPELALSGPLLVHTASSSFRSTHTAPSSSGGGGGFGGGGVGGGGGGGSSGSW